MSSSPDLDVAGWKNPDVLPEFALQLRFRVDCLICSYPPLFPVWVLFLVYPSVSSTVLQFFSCVEYGDSFYVMRYSPITKCYDAAYQATIPFAYLMVLVWPFGIPVRSPPSSISSVSRSLSNSFSHMCAPGCAEISLAPWRLAAQTV